MILIISDSLGLPRLKPEVVKSYETYPQLLQKYYKEDVYHQGQGGALAHDILNYLNYFDIEDFEKIILHFGIVDCAPRPFNKYENHLLRGFSLNSKIDYFLRKYRNIKKTKISDFEKFCLEINRRCLGKLLVLPICYSGPAYEMELPNIAKNVRDYNQVMNRVFSVQMVDLKLNEEHFMTDHHHLSKQGHEQILVALKERLSC